MHIFQQNPKEHGETHARWGVSNGWQMGGPSPPNIGVMTLLLLHVAPARTLISNVPRAICRLRAHQLIGTGQLFFKPESSFRILSSVHNPSAWLSLHAYVCMYMPVFCFSQVRSISVDKTQLPTHIHLAEDSLIFLSVSSCVWWPSSHASRKNIMRIVSR